jgi:hypothetical protein
MSHGTKRMLALAAMLVAGCARGPSIQLEAPPVSAPLEVRMEAYQNLRPLKMRETHVRDFGVIFGRRYEYVDYVELGSGQRVAYPETLLSVVDPDSPTADITREAKARRKRARRMGYVGWALVAAGLGTMIGGASADDTTTKRALLIGGAATVATGISLRIGRRYVKHAEYRLERDAFLAYDLSLRQRLNVCLDRESADACDVRAREVEWERPASGDGEAEPEPPRPGGGVQWERPASN